MENLNNIRTGVAAANLQSALGVEKSDQIRGVRKGDTAIIDRKGSDLSDLNEEIGNAVAHLAGRRALGQSKLRQGSGISESALRRIAKYQERLPDAPSEAKLLDLVKHLEAFEEFLEGQRGGGSEGLQAVLEALRDMEGNSRAQYMLLQGARLHFTESGGRDDMVSLLDKADATFVESGIAYDVRADFAVLVHAGGVEFSGVQPTDLTDKYRQMLVSGMNLGQLFYALSDLFKRVKFNAATDLFLTAAGDDLATTSSETDHIFLGSLLKQLGIIKTFRTVHEAGNHLIGEMRRKFPGYADEAETGGAGELVGMLLTFCAKQVPNIEDGRKIIKRFDGDGSSPKASVEMCNGVVELHRLIPDGVFPSNSARLQQAEVLLEVSGGYVEIEEWSQEAS